MFCYSVNYFTKKRYNIGVLVFCKFFSQSNTIKIILYVFLIMLWDNLKPAQVYLLTETI